jgi:predicted transcriptional regulator
MNSEVKTLSRGELLKHLRATFPDGVKRAQALQKEQKHMQEQLCALIRERPRTVLEVAEATGIPAAKVLWYLSALKKYGIVEEAGMCGDYPLYKKVEED